MIAVTSPSKSEAGATPLVLSQMGAQVVLVHVHQESEPGVEALRGAQALVVTGGTGYRRQGPALPLREVEPARYERERALVDRALQLSIPILGICRGMQVMNEALGGTTATELSEESLARHVQPERRSEAVHEISIQAESWLASALGATTARVNSLHRQGIDTLGRGLEIVARAPDGVVEAVEGKVAGTFVLGLQYHPELLLSHHGVLRAFLDCAAQKRA